MAKYVTRWNVLTRKGMRKPGKIIELTEEEAGALPAGSVEPHVPAEAPKAKRADTEKPAA